MEVIGEIAYLFVDDILLERLASGRGIRWKERLAVKMSSVLWGRWWRVNIRMVGVSTFWCHVRAETLLTFGRRVESWFSSTIPSSPFSLLPFLSFITCVSAAETSCTP